MRIYDTRIGKFLSVDPLSRTYPFYTPYQYAGNSPIGCVDIDELKPAPYQMMRNQQAIREYEADLRKKDPENADAIIKQYNINAFMLVGGGLVIGYGAAIYTSVHLYQLASAATWLSVPNNQLILSTATGFVFSVTNPDPSGAPVDFPGVGDEIGRTANLRLRTKAGRIVPFLMEKSGKFSNNSEWKWAQRLLDEGNNVALMKDVNIKGVSNADLFVNGVRTEIKELSNMTPNENFIRNLENKFYEASNQASNVIIDGSSQIGFTKEIAEQTLKEVQRKIKANTTFRIVGDGFEINETINTIR